MFLSYRSLGAMALLLLGIIFGFAWYLTKDPSEGALQSGANSAISFLTRSFDQDFHFNHRYGLDGTLLPVSYTEQFDGEVSAAIVLAQAARTDSRLTDIHQKNLSIILKDWYTETGEASYLTNGIPTMEQNGVGILLLSVSPLFEEERRKAELLAVPIASWAGRELSSYWKAESSTPAGSLGYGILGIASLYSRTGNAEHKETLELLAARYRLLLDTSPLRTLVRSALFETLKQEEDARTLLLAAKTYLPLQDKNFFSRNNGLFTEEDGKYYPVAEQALIIEGLSLASKVATSLGDTASVAKFNTAITHATGALLRTQVRGSGPLEGAALEKIDGDSVSAFATAHLIEALEPMLSRK